MASAPVSSPIRMNDTLGSSIMAAGGFRQGGAGNFISAMFGRQLALAAYQVSGLMRKAIRIPADDRVREWRDWQADAEQTTALEAEERRLGLIAKFRQAEILRGIGGGALILALPGNPSEPAPVTIGKGQLTAVNVVYRTQLTLVDISKEMTDPNFGLPAFYQFGANQTKIHPSRVIPFRGDPIAAGALAISDEDAFWGDCRLDQIFREGQRTDDTKGWFSELVKKAKLLRIGIPDVAELTATAAGQAKLDARIGLIGTGESILNATVFAAAGRDGAPGETVTDFQVTWAGIPAIMDAFDQAFAAVADIPFTRLYGRSPAGMNATGKSDDNNWNKMVATGQKLDTRPCLEQLDPFLMQSAGVDPAAVTWKFAPLDVPSEQDEATTFDKTMDAVTKLQATGAIPEVAFTKGVQNLMAEREYMPGLDQALAEIPEDERFGITTEPSNDNTDPSAIQGGGDPSDLAEAGGGGSVPRRRAANDARLLDATPRPLYVSRKVVNVADLKAWAKSQGLPELQGDLHVTVAYSTTPVDWMKMTEYDGFGSSDDGTLTLAPGGPRVVEPLGDRTAVLMFYSTRLGWRHEEMVRNGASWDFPDFTPHISLTGEPVDLTNVEPYRGKIVLGPEIFEVIDNDRT
ncbi:DUF1073 domain-containing protein [Sphingomonas faeni]